MGLESFIFLKSIFLRSILYSRIFYLFPFATDIFRELLYAKQNKHGKNLYAMKSNVVIRLLFPSSLMVITLLHPEPVSVSVYHTRTTSSILWGLTLIHFFLASLSNFLHRKSKKIYKINRIDTLMSCENGSCCKAERKIRTFIEIRLGISICLPFFSFQSFFSLLFIFRLGFKTSQRIKEIHVPLEGWLDFNTYLDLFYLFQKLNLLHVLFEISFIFS